MKILVLDDTLYTLHNIARLLENNGHEVIICSSIFSMNEQYLLNKHNIDCLIVDLELNPFGLSETEISETNNGLLAGWIWLKNYVLNEESYEVKCIIFSAYIDELKKSLTDSKEISLLNNIVLISKGEFDVVESLLSSNI